MNWVKASASGAMSNCVELAWQKAGASALENCVEVACCDLVHIRDSKHPEAGHHDVTRRAMGTFLADIKAGRFDLP